MQQHPGGDRQRRSLLDAGGYDALDAAVPVIRFPYTRSQQADRMQTLIYQRNQLTRVIGMDVPGRADAGTWLGVYEAEEWPSGDYSENRRRRRVYHLYGDESAG